MARRIRKFATPDRPGQEQNARAAMVQPKRDVLASPVLAETPKTVLNSGRLEVSTPQVNERVARFGPRFASIPVHTPGTVGERGGVQRSLSNSLGQNVKATIQRRETTPGMQGILQRRIESGKLNMVGENHNESNARRGDEKAMIQEKYGISDANYWEEDTFHYTADGAQKHGDSLVLLVLQSASFLLADIASLDRRVEALIGNHGDGFTELFDKGAVELVKRLDSTREEAQQLDLALERLEQSADAAANKDMIKLAAGVVDAVYDGVDYYAPRLHKPEDADDRDELVEHTVTPLSVSLDAWKLRTISFLEANHYKPGDNPSEVEDQVTGERSVHMFMAAEEAAAKAGKTGVWKIGEHHIRDMTGTKTTNTTITPQKDFNDELKTWKTPK